ncbi:MAG: class IV adenylate cyclase [Vicinamibacterales bacterium]
MALEQEVKLPFDTARDARDAITAAGGRLVVARRLLDDRLYDTADEWLRHAGQALRVRQDAAEGVITYKGPAQPGPVKSREEIETVVASPDQARAILEALGFRPWFHAQKYREEFALRATRATIDETPIGVFVEIEGAPPDIEQAANLLGRSRHDYVLESYPRLYQTWCASHAGADPHRMVF